MMELASTSRLLKVLADETRLRILNLLSREELTGTDLMEILNMGQSRISTHLTLLKEVGLVTDRRAGRRSYYSRHGNGAAAELLAQVLEENADSAEFAADVSALEDLTARRKNESRSYFDRVAATFGEQILPGRTWEGLCRALLQLAPRVRYADLGIGDGLLTMMLAEVAESVTAVDISPKMLDLLRQRAKGKGLSNIETVEGDIEALPLEPGSFDVAVLSQALHHARSPEQAIAEAIRILRPGGRLLIIDLLGHTEEWVIDKLQHRHLGFSESALRGLLERVGLEGPQVQRAARDPHPPHFMTLVATGTKPR